MSTTYAVKWREPDGQTYLGRLSLGAQFLGLEGRKSGGHPVERRIASSRISAACAASAAVKSGLGLPPWAASN